MKLLMLLPLLVFTSITTQLKTCKVPYNHPEQKSVVLETEVINPLNPFCFFYN